MTIFTKQALIESSPAFNVFRREADRDGFVNITAADTLALKVSTRSGDFHRTYSAGSVVSYALENNECPIQAIEDCKAKMVSYPYAGHKLHWINANGSMLTSHARPAETVIEVILGMRVRFQGLLATIEADHNNNLRFAPVAAAA